jgi:hypothetical protein
MKYEFLGYSLRAPCFNGQTYVYWSGRDEHLMGLTTAPTLRVGLRWMAATLDDRVEASGAVFEAKFMLPWSFSEEAAAEKYMPQLQHNMWVVTARSAVLSVITGGGKWVEIKTHADPLYQHLIVTAQGILDRRMFRRTRLSSVSP